MKFQWPFQRKSVSYDEIDLANDSAAVYSVLLGVSDNAPKNLQPRQSYYLAERSSDLGGAINKILKPISSMILLIYESDGTARYNDPLLDLLNEPGETRDKSILLSELTESYLLTSESWMIARGNVNRPPLALMPIRPYDVSVIFNEADGMPQFIETQSPFDRRVYTRRMVGKELRYYDAKELNEIIPIIGQRNLTDQWRGRSPLNKLYYDVTINESGKRHNKSLLDNGLRTTAVISPKDKSNASGTPAKWSEKAVETLQKTIRAFHQGAGNAGNSMIIGTPVDVQGMTQNNKDMDFISLLNLTKEAIYNLYDIPLPLILSDAMTLSNYTVAQRAFYTNAVFPVFNSVACGIINGLRPRYKSLQRGETLGYSEIDIPGMRPILVEDMKQLKDTEAVTVNEIRATGGFDDDPNGDAVLVMSSKTTLESVTGGGSFSGINFDDAGMDEEEGQDNDDILKALKDIEESIESKSQEQIVINAPAINVSGFIEKKKSKKTIQYTDIDGNHKVAHITEEES
jgi:HK97 family phage portal protein